MKSLVLRENKHGAAILTLNRPEKLNALTKDVFEALDEHVEAIARQTRDIGLVVLRGAGGNFSSGYDMAEALELALAADLVIAGESARFSDAYAHWGLTPIWGLSLRLPHRVGRAKAT